MIKPYHLNRCLDLLNQPLTLLTEHAMAECLRPGLNLAVSALDLPKGAISFFPHRYAQGLRLPE